MYSKILVPIDGSATSERGLLEAIGLAKAVGARLVLLNVVQDFKLVVELAAVSASAETHRALTEEARQILARAAAKATQAGVGVETVLQEQVSGRAAEVILDQARRQDCGLIVMGTHGRRGFNRLILGSDAELVTRETPVPVLLVRPADAA